MTDPIAPELAIEWQTNMDVTTSSGRAAYFFNQGLYQLYAFNHDEADRAFKEAIRLDSTCVMCHWGVAIGLGPNINVSMKQSDNADAVRYSQKALALLNGDSKAYEVALTKALAKRYSSDTLLTRTFLDSIYAEEMRLVTQEFRSDMDIATLFVEALMDCMPWNYWHADGQPKAATREALAVLNYIKAEAPSHPGANHLCIHLVEEVHPDLATPNADSLAALPSTAGHLIHMPSHIYMQTGRYREASLVNEKAIEADEDYFKKCEKQGKYPAIYYPHNIHFLSYSASFEGRSQVALEAADKLVANTPLDKVVKYPSLEQYLPVPYYAQVRFERWDQILANPRPKYYLNYTRLMWHYARGLALVAKGESHRAGQELGQMRGIVSADVLSDVHTTSFPAQDLARMVILVLDARIASANDEHAAAVMKLKQAVAIQDALIFVEIPFIFVPLRQELGRECLRAGRYADAAAVFIRDLVQFPSNAWSLHGLWKAQLKQGKSDEAKASRAKFELAWRAADCSMPAD